MTPNRRSIADSAKSTSTELRPQSELSVQPTWRIKPGGEGFRLRDSYQPSSGAPRYSTRPRNLAMAIAERALAHLRERTFRAPGLDETPATSARRPVEDSSASFVM